MLNQFLPMERCLAGMQLGSTMKLTAIMLILNSFFSTQDGVDVVNSVFQPVTHISAETRLNHSEYEREKKIIESAAAGCRAQNLLEQLNEFSSALMECYEDPEIFPEFLAHVQKENGSNPAKIILQKNDEHRSILNLFLTKLDEFDYKSSKREHNAQLIADSKLLRSVAFQAEAALNELDMLVNQFTVSDVPMDGEFLSDDEIAHLAAKSEEVLSSLQA